MIWGGGWDSSSLSCPVERNKQSELHVLHPSDVHVRLIGLVWRRVVSSVTNTAGQHCMYIDERATLGGEEPAMRIDVSILPFTSIPASPPCPQVRSPFPTAYLLGWHTLGQQ